jgi:AraC family transcriptional regulator
VERPGEINVKDRETLERAVERYAQACFRQHTAVRASELATELNITAPYLSRIAREVMGEPIREFLRKKQLAHAAHLLRTTSRSIGEIALAAGFGTPTTFYRTFRKAFATTPDAYRNIKK